MNDLKDILADAARYRWLREQLTVFIDEGDGPSSYYLDVAIDKYLLTGHE